MAIFSKLASFLDTTFLGHLVNHSNLDISILTDVGLISALYQFTFLSVANIFDTDHFTDFAGTTNFIVNVLYSLYASKGSISGLSRSLLATSSVGLWGTRLASFLAYRISKLGGDDRLETIRKKSKLRYGFFFFMQFLWAVLVSYPVVALNSKLGSNYLAPIVTNSDIAALGLIGAGQLIQLIADFQKLSFKLSRSEDPDNAPLYLDQGIWKYSRQPNYFGEILTWIGTYLYCLTPSDQAIPFLSRPLLTQLTVISPIFTSLLLLKVSGFPHSEKIMKKKIYEQNQDPKVQLQYQKYKASTSPLLPLPNQFYRKVPLLVKTYLLLDFWAVAYPNGFKQE